MFPIIEKALTNLGVANCAIYGEPKSEQEFYDMVKPVTGVDEHGTNCLAETPEQYTITYTEFAAEVSRLQAEHEYNEYQRRRVAEYQPIGDQLDNLFKAIDAGLFGESAKTSEFYQHIKSVKEAHAKGAVYTQDTASPSSNNTQLSDTE
jgi:hypothetical protein